MLPWPKNEHVFGLDMGKIKTCGVILVSYRVKEVWRLAGQKNGAVLGRFVRGSVRQKAGWIGPRI